MKYSLNKDQPLEIKSSYMSWQILDENRNLVCDFRGPESFMCCMAALEKMNKKGYTMDQAKNTYEEFVKVRK